MTLGDEPELRAKRQPRTPQHVIASYFLIAGLYTLAAALIWGVNTLFLLDAGLDIFGVFVANAAFTAGSGLRFRLHFRSSAAF